MEPLETFPLRSRSSKRPRPTVVEALSVATIRIPWRWNDFLEEGDESFQYMLDYFPYMMDSHSIRHFDILEGSYQTCDKVDTLKETSIKQIECELIPWIRREVEENRLMEKTHWKPFREPNDYSCMYLGYNQLFPFKHYYFQLAIQSGCRCENCLHCSTPEYGAHFEVALYGWTQDDCELLQPSNKVTIGEDCQMPEVDWIRK